MAQIHSVGAPGAVFFLFLYRGDTGPNALTMWLRLLPLGGNIGLCGRWVIPLIFCVGVLVALGAQSLCERPQQWALTSAKDPFGSGRG